MIRTIRDVILSLLKSGFILLICVAANLIGIVASQLTKNILFVDLTGTAMASLVYGPIHGALVGLSSNMIGEFFVGPALSIPFKVNLQHYLLFAPVHMVTALVWSVLPRLMRGRLATDLFCDDEKHYASGKILFGILGLAMASNLAASAVIAIIVVSYSPTLGCAAAGGLQAASTGDAVLCNFVLLMYGGQASTDAAEIWRLFTAKAIIGYPDHIISFAAAVLLVAFILDGRRYKMRGEFAKTIVTNRPFVATCYFVLMTWLMYIYIGHSRLQYGADSTYAATLVCFFFVIVFWFLNISGKFQLVLFIRDHREHLYQHLNKELKDAYEDSMKAAVLFSVCLYFWIEWLRKSVPAGSAGAADFFQAKLFGALGVAFLITFVRYFVLVLARMVRVCRQWWHYDHQNHDIMRSN